MNERTILRFLKLIECDNVEIGTYAKLVDDRNDAAHSNGNIYLSEETALDRKITEILRVVDEIQTHSRPVILECYKAFLLNSYDPETREYADDGDQIREALIHQNYLSERDIQVCLAFDLSVLHDHPEAAAIETLHQSLRTLLLRSRTRCTRSGDQPSRPSPHC